MSDPTPSTVAGERPRPTLGEVVAVFFRIGCVSFGGPAGQIALMHKLLVDEKRWLGEREYLAALQFCMLLPGPEAQQLATWMGWRVRGVVGGLVSGALFVLPGAVLMLALAAAYALYGKLPAVEAVFLGIKAAVVVIVVEALMRVARRALKSRAAYLIAGAAFVAIAAFAVPFPVVVAVAGIVGAAVLRPATAAAPAPAPATSAPGGLGPVGTALVFGAAWGAPVALAALALGPAHVLVDVGLFFSKLAVVTFGGAYAVLAYMAQQAVETKAWLSAAEMLDGFGLAETTPGPLILVTQFVGFLAGFRAPEPFSPLVAGALAAAMTTWVTFAPSYLWIFLGAPLLERVTRIPALGAALAGITAAVVGVILSVGLWFAVHVLFRGQADVALGPLRLILPVPSSVDPVAVVLALLAAVALFRFHVSVVTLVALAGAAGYVASLLPL